MVPMDISFLGRVLALLYDPFVSLTDVDGATDRTSNSKHSTISNQAMNYETK